MVNLVPAPLSLCFVFRADAENGSIGNIAGQMPMKGRTILSGFAAAIAPGACRRKKDGKGCAGRPSDRACAVPRRGRMHASG